MLAAALEPRHWRVLGRCARGAVSVNAAHGTNDWSRGLAAPSSGDSDETKALQVSPNRQSSEVGRVALNAQVEGPDYCTCRPGDGREERPPTPTARRCSAIVSRSQVGEPKHLLGPLRALEPPDSGCRGSSGGMQPRLLRPP